MKQKQALEILKTGRNVFVTGAAGSGKTHLVNEYIKYLKEYDVDIGITASTGIAATHMGGVTIHSWAGIGITAFLTEEDLAGMKEKSYLVKRFEKVKVLIIDEVSMLHHFRLDLVDQVLRTMKDKSNDPFGGVQVILCGDFFQLPPVARFGEPDAHFIFKSDAWQNGGFTVCYLDEQFRQSDDAATSILNEIRSGKVSEKSKKLLADRFNKRTLDIPPTKLFTHNEDVDAINFAELEKLGNTESGLKTASPSSVYIMETKGKPFLVEALKKSCLAPSILTLKVGARVMCVKNNFEQGYVNGTLGVVVSCKSDQDPVVRLTNGRVMKIEKASWKVEENGVVKAELTQYPLRLAWAITVHKSQGMSLDAVEVDLSKAFEPGMGYVALSRVRTLNGLTILGLNETALHVNEDVLEFDELLQDLSKQAEENILSQTKESLSCEQKEFLEYIAPESVRPKGGKVGKGGNRKKEKKLPSHEETAELLLAKKSLEEIAKSRNLVSETVIKHIELVMEEVRSGIREPVDIGYLRKEISPTHWKKIIKAFDEVIEEQEDKADNNSENFAGIYLSPVKQKVGPQISFLHIRLARVIKGLVPKER